MRILQITQRAETQGSKKYFLKDIVKSVAGPVLGGVIGGGSSAINQNSANQASAREAQKSRDFTREQMQNRHQWEAADLRKAGRNPILYSGSTPSTGSSAMATQQAPNMANDAAQGVSSAIAAKRAYQELKNLKAQENLIKSQANNQNAQARYAGNKSGIIDPLSTLAGGLSGASESSAKAMTDLTNYVQDNYKKLKSAPRDYSRYVKNKLNSAKSAFKRKLKGN